ncbi:MAG: DUF853 domain-containing protein, partial [Acidobacteria bacterium]|nr:DUF853 domain-containing protein [Acidobacteriota bacterium]
STFPHSSHYDISSSLKSLGIGEALVSLLTPKGAPNEVAVTQIVAPTSSMAPLDPNDYDRRVASSAMSAKYRVPIDRHSAHEILQQKLADAKADERERELEKREQELREREERAKKKPAGRTRMSHTERITGNVLNQAARSVTGFIMREMMGVLRGKRR